MRHHSNTIIVVLGMLEVGRGLETGLVANFAILEILKGKAKQNTLGYIGAF